MTRRRIYNTDTQKQNRPNIKLQKNPIKFVNKIKGMIWEKEDLLVNFDVVCLFTKVPDNDTLDIIKKNGWLEEKLYKQLKTCTRSAIFTYKTTIYQQTDGMVIGFRLTQISANIFMEWLKPKAILTSNIKPNTWFRYEDDTYVQWEHGQKKNDVHDSKLWTLPLENDTWSGVETSGKTNRKYEWIGKTTNDVKIHKSFN